MAEPTSSRQVPMQVLALGLPRTGTSLMQAALSRLGYNDTYHSFDMLSRPQDILLWERASEAKFYGLGKTTHTERLGRAARPMCSGDRHVMRLFCDELIEVYPEAEVVLESWHKSFSTNVIGISSAAPQTS